MTDKEFLKSLNSVIDELIALGSSDEDFADFISHFVLHPNIKHLAIAQTGTTICQIEIPKEDFVKMEPRGINEFVRVKVISSMYSQIVKLEQTIKKLDFSTA